MDLLKADGACERLQDKEKNVIEEAKDEVFCKLHTPADEAIDETKDEVFCKLQTPAAPHPGQALLGAAETIDESIDEVFFKLQPPADEAIDEAKDEVFCKLPQPSVSPPEIMRKLPISDETIDEEIVKEFISPEIGSLQKTLNEEESSNDVEESSDNIEEEIVESSNYQLTKTILEEESNNLLAKDSNIKIIDLNSKIIPNNETLLPDCKEIKIIEKKFEEDKEIKNIEILKMDNVENKLKNIFDLDKIMNDFNNLFTDLSNEEKELPKNQNICSEKVEKTSEGIVRRLPVGLVPDAEPPESGACERLHKKISWNPEDKKNEVLYSSSLNISPIKQEIKEIKKDTSLLYNKLVNYQNINYKIPTIRILPTQNLNFSNLYSSQIDENNILLNPNLSIELGKDNLSYLIKFGNQKYLINKTNNSIVLTNLFNKNSQIIKNKDNFKIGMLDYILYNDCTLLMQVTNKTYFDNSYGRTISVYTPKF